MLIVVNLSGNLIVGENSAYGHGSTIAVGGTIDSVDVFGCITLNVPILLTNLISFDAIIELSIGGTVKLIRSDVYYLEIPLQC